jgi:hypothetical protein
MLDKPFMDEVYRATYHEMFADQKDDQKHRNVLSRYRQALKRAQRFVLDDATVRMLCHLTRHERKMDLWSILARLPYDTVWIEHDLHTKVLEWQTMGTLKNVFKPEEVSKPVGYLIQRDLDSQTRWVATEFSEYLLADLGDRRMVMPAPVSMVFDPEGSVLKPVTGCLLWNEQTLSKLLGKPLISVNHWSMDGDGIEYPFDDLRVDPEFCYLGLGKIDAKGEIFEPKELSYKVGCVPSLMWRDLYGMSDAKVQQQFVRVMLEDAVERSGILKYLIVMLATINDVPLTTKWIKPRGTMLTKGGPIHRLDHYEVGIKVPKTMDVRYVGRTLDKAAVHAQRAWHRVRGHWRIIEPGKRLPILCRHEPTLVDNGLAICQRCERLIRWITDHHRGNPALGVIDHSYQVHA